jgi:ribose 5-phosphate isomerase B
MASSRRPLITERDVRRAHADGTTALDTANAVVTPSARDAAKTLGVSLRSSQVSTEATAPGPVPGPAPAEIVVGADHGGLPLKDAILAHLRKAGMSVSDVGTHGSAAVDYPDFAVAVARTVADGRATFGVMVDGAGIGSCMACNKVPGVRAAMCYDITTAALAREHNNANVLTLGGTLIGPRLALEIVDTFLRTPYGGGRHQSRVDKVDALLPRPA